MQQQLCVIRSDYLFYAVPERNAILPVTNLCDHLKTEPWQLAFDAGTKDFIYTAYAVS